MTIFLQLKQKKITEVLTLSIILLLYLRLNISSYISPGDDAYITLTYVRNLYLGNGFVYNLGEKVLGTTTPLYTVILALVCKLFSVDPETAAFPFGLLFGCLNIFVFYKISKKIIGELSLALFGTLFFTLSWNYTVSTTLCMETPLFIFTLLMSTFFQLGSPSRRNNIISGSFSALAAMTRPEGGLLIICILLLKIIKDKIIAWDELFSFLITILPWTIFAFYYFGSPVPNSMIAKSIAYTTLPGQAYQGLSEHFIAFFLKQNSSNLGTSILLIITFIITISSVYFLSFVPIISLFPLSFITLYSLANPYIFIWYLVPLEPFYILIAIKYLSLWFNLYNQKYIYLKKLTIGILIFYLIAISLLQYKFPLWNRSREESSPILSLARSADERIENGLHYFLTYTVREDLYKDFAWYLKDKINNKTVILASEFGAFGYYSEAKIISSLGHMNPEIFKYYPIKIEDLKNNTAITIEMLKGLLPDYILSLDVLLGTSITNKDLWFEKNYKLEKKLDSNAFRSTGIYLYKKF